MSDHSLESINDGNYHRNIRLGYGPVLVFTRPAPDSSLADRQARNRERRLAQQAMWPSTLVQVAKQRVKNGRKYTGETMYLASVGGHVVSVRGRTKREATKRARLAFARAGIKTMPSPFVDLLEITVK